jgi:D-xylose transport system permease protein
MADDKPSGTGTLPDEEPDRAARRADLAMPAELLSGSISEYVRTTIVRIRGGEAGVLPVIAGLVVISIVFQGLNSNFLTAGNLVNLLVQGAVFCLLALGEVFVLILGEIDLSIGYVSAISGVVVADTLGPHYGWPWYLAIGAALLVCACIGLVQGLLITVLGLPSFVVTLGGLLFWQGMMLHVIGSSGSIPISDPTVVGIAANNISATAGWIVMLVIVGVFGLTSWRRDAKRRAAGLVAPPPGVTLLKVAVALAVGVGVLLLCNTNRGRIAAFPIRGVPYVVLLVLAVLAVYTFLLGRTKIGRYWLAIGGNAEAARRAGISLIRIRTLAFVMCSFTGGIAGIVYASRLDSVSTAVDGGNLVLYAVAAAVIGGASLFGGRGKALHAVLGGIVIASIDNGMGLVGYTAAAQKMVTALVLLAAVTIDALSRRGRIAGT